MDVRMLGLPYALLLSALSLVTVSATQKCIPQAMPDMVIDINQAVARGARFTDPLSVTSVEECLSACCMQVDVGGDLDCNLLVFDSRKVSRLQNCYIFHCPTLDSCPLLPSPGVLSYSLWSEPSQPRKPAAVGEPQRPESGDRGEGQSSPRKTLGLALLPSRLVASGPLDSNLGISSAAIVSQGSARQNSQQEPPDSSRSFTTQLLHLAGQDGQHLEKMEPVSEDNLKVRRPSPPAVTVPAIRTTTVQVKKVSPDAKAAKPGRVTHKNPGDLEINFPATLAGTTPFRTKLSTAAPQLVPRTKTSLIVPPGASQDVNGISKVPSSDIKSAKLPGGDHTAKNAKKVDQPRLLDKGVPAPATAQTRTPQMVTRPAPLRPSPWKGTDSIYKTNDHPQAGDDSETPPPAQQEHPLHLEEAPRKAEGARSGGTLPTLEDKSGLVAALVFGMLFLMVVIGLVSRKVSEARRRHRYTKLDYLINGMYVDT